VLLSLVKESNDIGKNQCDKHEHGNDPEHDFVNAATLRQRAYLSRFARCCGPENPASREEESDYRRANKIGAIRFELG
jgi:hypothetical protein